MRRVVINADDLGYDPAVTRGIVEAMSRGVVTSATFMVNTPHSEAAALAAAELPSDRGLGLHLNLARGEPLSDAFEPELLEDGDFNEAHAARLPVDAVAQETRAQIERFIALLGRAPTHVDVHKHLHRHANVLDGLMVVALERRLPVRSITEPMRQTLRERGVATNAHFLGDAGAQAYWTVPQLLRTLATLPDEGLIELMCHPGYAPVSVKSGYAAQREVELATFTSPEARAAVAGLPLGRFESP